MPPDNDEGAPGKRRPVTIPTKVIEASVDPPASGIPWAVVLAEAARIVLSYDTAVTLRQLHYRLVSRPELDYPNTQNAYKALSSRTAELRRRNEFPELMDRTRRIHRRASWESPAEALAALTDQYRRDRTEGQDTSVFLGVEKAGMVAQLDDWFAALGLPILALSGYASQTLVDTVRSDVDEQGRPAVLLYAGDFDPSGEDIDRDFVSRTGCFDKVVRVALTAAQVATYQLPPAMGKLTDSRAAAFTARHGQLVQVELDALSPDVLRGLYAAALEEFWDTSAYQQSVDLEQQDRSRLRQLVAGSS